MIDWVVTIGSDERSTMKSDMLVESSTNIVLLDIVVVSGLNLQAPVSQGRGEQITMAYLAVPIVVPGAHE